MACDDVLGAVCHIRVASPWCLLAIGGAYTLILVCCTISDMDVAVSDLRAHLSEWLERARDGEEVVVTERGIPVARLLGIGAAATLERLAAEGVIGRSERATRPTASGRPRARARRSVSEIVSE